MIGFAYLGALLFSCFGMVMLDRKFRLALYADWRRTMVAVLVGVGIFVLWDICGIVLGVFFSGESPYLLGVYLGPEFPLEEIVFLSFLCYFTLITYRLWEVLWRRM